MNINFNLKDAKAEKSSLRLVVTHHGQVYHKAVGLVVPTKSWNKKTQKSKILSVDARLKDIRLYLESHLDEMSTQEDVKQALERALMTEDERIIAEQPKAPERVSFWQYFEEWANRESPAKRQRRLTYNVIARIMGTDADWEQVDSSFYFRLVRAMNQEGFSKNYQGTLVTKLKTVMSEGYKLKYHASTDYHEFHKIGEKVDNVYLTEEEIQLLYDAELDSERLRKTRDLFLLGVYSGARFSDYSLFSNDNIVGDTFRYYQGKTGELVILPLSPRVKTILKRNKGKAPEVSPVVFNREIKEVCRLAGIHTKVQKKVSKGTSHTVRLVPKWELVSSHTARRTCVTLLHESGVPAREGMHISGHKSLAAYETYLKTSKEETARKLASNKFFK